MYYKVRIKSLPKAKVGYQVDGSLSNDILSFGDSKSRLFEKVDRLGSDHVGKIMVGSSYQLFGTHYNVYRIQLCQRITVQYSLIAFCQI